MAAKSKYFSTQHIFDILVDADALVALVRDNDPNHKRALAISKRLQKQGCTWYVSPFTLAEVVTVISYKVNQTAAKKVLKELRKQELNLLSLKDEYLHLADDWFVKQNKKGTSYFDCYNMALLTRYKKQLSAIFSFDGVYKRNGFVMAGDELSE